MKRRPVARAAISSVVERATGEPLGCRHDREVIEEPLIDEFYELQARIATMGMELARTRGQEDGAAIESAPAFQKMLTMLGCAAPIEVPVLLLGEIGTGKENLAQSLHDQSHRTEGRFVAAERSGRSSHLTSEKRMSKDTVRYLAITAKNCPVVCGGDTIYSM